MDTTSILASIDAEIAKLERARDVLSGGIGVGNGRTAVTAKPKKRKLSAEARKRIADAQRKRWAAAKQEVASGNVKRVDPIVEQPEHSGH